MLRVRLRLKAKMCFKVGQLTLNHKSPSHGRREDEEKEGDMGEEREDEEKEGDMGEEREDEGNEHKEGDEGNKKVCSSITVDLEIFVVKIFSWFA